MTTKRPEARFEVDLLIALGPCPAIALYKNESGQGFYGVIRRRLTDPQHGLLRKLPALRAEADRILMQHRLSYGLGVGSPDLAGIGVKPCPHCRGPVPGAFKGPELKSATGRLSPEQKSWHAAAKARGADIAAVRTLDEGWALMLGGFSVDEARAAIALETSR